MDISKLDTVRISKLDGRPTYVDESTLPCENNINTLVLHID
jgi:hypothetical protein